MSYEYDRYLRRHKENVKKGYDWICNNMPYLVEDIPGLEWQTGFAHDQSKSEPDEYEAYNEYFYGNNKSYAVVQKYKKAWLLHIHRNPHHWQYWILINDDPKEGEILMEMPMNYILEIICDWWSFSWEKENLREIFSWYDQHKNYMNLQKFAKISEEKFTKYALDFEKSPDKAMAFKKALGYTKDNYRELIDDIDRHLNKDKLIEKGDIGYGMRYEQIMKLRGPNGKEANVLTGWIQDSDDLRLTSAYITGKKERK